MGSYSKSGYVIAVTEDGSVAVLKSPTYTDKESWIGDDISEFSGEWSYSVPAGVYSADYEFEDHGQNIFGEYESDSGFQNLVPLFTLEGVKV